MFVRYIGRYDRQVVPFGCADNMNPTSFRSMTEQEATMPPGISGVVLYHLALLNNASHLNSAYHPVGPQHLL